MAFVCLLTCELHLPDGADLKGKRKQLLSLRSLLARRFGAAVAETGHQDRWQRATLTIALVGEHGGPLNERADALQRFTDARCEDQTRWERRVLSTADLEA